MPYTPRRPCNAPGCTALAQLGESRCAKHSAIVQERRRERQRQLDAQRGSARERGYDSRWAKARATYLAEHPLCVECLKHGAYVEATVVDHIVPHKGDQKLFWDTGNWQPLCKPCHDRKTAREDGGWGNPRGGRQDP
jgi:5-methylcytosine-specific restriction protein A